MKKIFGFIALALMSVYAGAQTCETVPTSYTGNASITFQRYTHKALPGRFSVSSTQTVRFSQGNLQYRASTGKWRFAENQYTVIGTANTNISSSYDGWIDLFAYGASGNEVEPYSTSSTITSNITGTENDWAWHNAIINGGVGSEAPAQHQWRVLTQAEWEYLLARNSGTMYGFGKLFGKNGIFLLPDEWDWDDVEGGDFETNWASGEKSEDRVFTKNVIPVGSEAIWAALESAGVVFLPTTGYRSGTTVTSSYVTNRAYYWSSTARNASGSYEMNFRENGKISSGDYVTQNNGCAVRPVLDI